MIKVTVSGSFHRHLGAIYEAVQAFVDAGASVLSPADPRIVAEVDEFVFIASDRVRSVRLVQDRHLQCICSSALLWLVCPDGYIGPSAAMEVGFAHAIGVPIFSNTLPEDPTLQRYVRYSPSPLACTTRRTKARRSASPAHLLVDPSASIEALHRTLDELSPSLSSGIDADAAERHFGEATEAFARTLGLYRPAVNHE